MNRCIQLAKNGLGMTYPNPMVGCVLVYEDKIIGEGWHRKAGLPHAEVEAIRSVSSVELLNKATLYVSLEPCSHFGKTPPCSDLIIQSGIPKVVIGSQDPNPKVAGTGIQKLKAAGIHVTVGVLKEACKELNKRFFVFHQEKRPYIFLKWAESTDGFIAPSKKETQSPVWITNRLSRQWVHKLRAQEQAILIGAKTLEQDVPSLTTRNWAGSNPLRLILAQKTVTPEEIPLADTIRTIVFCKESDEGNDFLAYVPIDFDAPVAHQICQYLDEQEIQSLIVEGGRQTLQTFIDENLWDEALVFIGTNAINEGVPSPIFHGDLIHKTCFGEDRLLHYKNPDR